MIASKKYNQCLILKLLKSGFLYIFFCLITMENGWTQAIDQQQIAIYIKQLAYESESHNAINALVKIGSSSVSPLIDALGHKDARIRWGATGALAKLGEVAKSAVPALIKAMEDSDYRVRNGAIWALGNIGPEAKDAVPSLINAMENQSVGTRKLVIQTLNNIGPTARGAVPTLIELLKDSNLEIRRNAIWALAKIGDITKDAVPIFIELLMDSDADIRWSATGLLHNVGPVAKDAAPALMKLMEDPDARVRHGAIWALASIEPVENVVPILIKAMEDKDFQVRWLATDEIKKIGPAAKETVPILIKLLLNDSHYEVRWGATGALNSIGSEASEAIPALKTALEDSYTVVRWGATGALKALANSDGARDVIYNLGKALKDNDLEVRNGAMEAIERIAVNCCQKKQDNISTSELEKIVYELEKAKSMFEEPNKNKKLSTTLPNSIDTLKTELYNRKMEWIKKIFENKFIWIIVIYFVSLIFIWLILFWLKPLWLLQIHELLKSFEEIDLYLQSYKIKIPVVKILLVDFFYYRPRIMEKWVANSINVARDRFLQKPSVDKHKIHINIPILLKDSIAPAIPIPELRPESLKQTFIERRILVIYGEGGSGKTNLALQIAKWAMSDEETHRIFDYYMLPILIEQDHKFDEENILDSFLGVIEIQLRDLLNKQKAIDKEFLKQLLICKRILLIIDGISEMANRERLIKIAHKIPVNALIITSRVEERLDGITYTTINIPRIVNSQLLFFTEVYLKQLDKFELFSQSELFGNLKQFTDVLSPQEATVLLAKLYVQYMIEVKEHRVDSDVKNIPDLMLVYLNSLQRNNSRNVLRAIQKDAKIIAWLCLEKNHFPSQISYDQAIIALDPQGQNSQDAGARFKELEESLIISRINSDFNRFRFSLDTLAEYLAGLYLVDHNEEALWRQFLDQAKSNSNNREVTKDFLSAVLNCCLVEDNAIPNPFVEELRELVETQ